MKQTTIDLLQPFEEVLVAVLSTPESPKVIGEGAAQNGTDVAFPDRVNHSQTSSAELRGVVRCVYEAAHCRKVDTPIGPVTIASLVAASLTDEPFHIKTQAEFLLEVVTRIISGVLHCQNGISTPQTSGNRRSGESLLNRMSHIDSNGSCMNPS